MSITRIIKIVKHLIWLQCLLLLFHNIVAFAAISRNIDPAGSIVSTKGQEHIRLVSEQQWLKAEVTQTLTSGDALKTGRYGGLAILFRDETQIRIHNNSFLLIKDIAKKKQKNNTLLKLDYGRIWMRAITQPDKLQVDTPSASLAVRGTDWVVTVGMNGQSQLVVLEGEIRFFNTLGSVVVRQGESAIAEIGKPPRKIFLIKPDDKPYWNLILTSEWVELFLSPKQNSKDLKAHKIALEKQPATQDSIENLLELAEITFSLSDLKASKDYLKRVESKLGSKTISYDNRVKILWGLIELRQSNNLKAQNYFEQTSPYTDKKHLITARLGLIVSLIQQKKYSKAEEHLKDVEESYGYMDDTYFLDMVLTSYRGDQQGAIAKCKKAQILFTDDVRFHAFLAHLYLLQGNAENMKNSIDKAIHMNPNVAFVWHWLGLYHQGIKRKYQKAIYAYEKALQLNPYSMASWHNLSVIYLARTEYDKAEKLISKAIESAPNVAFLYATYAQLLMSTDQLNIAETQLKSGFDIDPSDPNLLYGMGLLTLLQGNVNKSIEWFEKSIVSNPDSTYANITLGEAFYEFERVEDAQKALKTVRRLDQDNPYPARDLAIIAIDHARAGDAIRYARESHEKYKKLGHSDFSDTRNIQDSASVAEFSYRQLSLNDWGDSFSQKSFSPYLPGGYFANSVQLGSFLGRRSSLIQGELINPLSVSGRNRYYDFWRRPFNDFTFFAGIGDEDGAFTDTESLTIQGLSRSRPVSYRLSGTRSHKDGFRENSRSDVESFSVKLGTVLDEKNGLLLSFSGTHNHARLPGTTVFPTLNDSIKEYFYEGSLGYRLRISPNNYMLFRASGGYARSNQKNDNPFGLRLSSLESSLLNFVGLNLSNALLQQGLCDVRNLFGVNRPVFFIEQLNPFVGSTCTFLGQNILQSNISTNQDFRTLKSISQKQTFFALQFRHMFDIGDFQMTYGAEWLPSNIVTKREFTIFQQNNGEIATLGTLDDFFVFMSLGDFPFGNNQLIKSRNEFNRDAVFSYIKGRWSVNPDLWIESSLHRRYYRNENIDIGQWDPSVGFAYQLTSRQWLRAVAQRSLYFDYQPDTVNILSQQGSLAPTTTVGIAPSDAYLTDGSSSQDYILRWDAEWSPHLFTFMQLGERRIKRFLNIFSVDKGRIRSVKTGLNVWFAEQFGFSSSYQYNDTENRSSSIYRGKALPLIAKHNFTASLNYIHPKQFRASINQVFTSSRSADIANTEQLKDFWSTNIVLNWQPFDKHLSFNFAINNLFDKKSELIKNVPQVGRSVFFSIEGRY